MMSININSSPRVYVIPWFQALPLHSVNFNKLYKLRWCPLDPFGCRENPAENSSNSEFEIFLQHQRDPKFCFPQDFSVNKRVFYTRKIGNYSPRKRKKKELQKKNYLLESSPISLSVCEILFSLGIGFFKKPLFPCVTSFEVGVYFFLMEWRLCSYRSYTWQYLLKWPFHRVFCASINVGLLFLGLYVSSPIGL